MRRLAQLKQRGRRGFRPRLQFSESGYYLLGSSFDTPDEVRLIADAGPLGYLSLAAHGHADALSFVLSIGDREILVDPGTYAYHTEPAWRRYFRSTLAHNTVGIDGQDQSVQAGNFMWTDHAQARCIEFEVGHRAAALRRRALRLSAVWPIPWSTGAKSCRDTRRQIIEVTDMIRCDREHRARRSWHFAEDCQVESVGNRPQGHRRAHAGVFRSRAKSSTAYKLHRGGSATQGGWVSRSFGRKQPSTRCTGIRASRVSRCCARAFPTRGRAPLASEPVISEVELHQVVTADVPSGERTHVAAPRRLLRALQRDRRHRRRDAQRSRPVSRRCAPPVAPHADHRRPAAAAARRDAARRQRAAHGEPHQSAMCAARAGASCCRAARCTSRARAYIWDGVCHEMIRVRNFALSTVSVELVDPLRFRFREHRRRARAATRRCGALALRARRTRQRHAGLPRRGRRRARDRGRLPHRRRKRFLPTV